MINKLSTEIHETAKSKGFYDGERNIGEVLALIHSEVSEALEADRKNHYTRTELSQIVQETDNEVFKSKFEESIKNTFEDELADILIRVMDLAGYRGVDLEEHLKAKVRYNSLREHKHGKKY
ncbi:MAG: hypothetical protein ACPGTP_03490 [Bacteroidia bacterium]